MAMTIQNSAQHTSSQRLDGWLKSEGLAPSTAKPADLERAAEQLGLSVADVQGARDALIASAALQAESGSAAGTLTGRHLDSAQASYGGASFQQSGAMLVKGQGGSADVELDPMSQQGMNQTAWRELSEAKERMGALAKQIKANLGDDVESQVELDKALKAFDKYAQAEGEFAGNLEARGGSLAPLVNAGAQKRLVDAMVELMGHVVDFGYWPLSGSSTVNDAPQQVMNQAAYEAFHAADARMQELAGKLSAQLADVDADSVKELSKTQKEHGKFREALATLAGNMEARGGSLFGLIHANALEALTVQRSKVLEEHLGLTA